jgi:hypothetical protein
MSVQSISSLHEPLLSAALVRGHLSLWILPNASAHDVADLAGVAWTNVWNLDHSIDFEQIIRTKNESRHLLIINSAEQDVIEFSPKEYLRVYRPKDTTNSASPQIRAYETMRLKSRVEAATGLLVFVGPIDSGSLSEIALVREFAPHLVLLSLSQPTEGELSTNYVWDSELKSFCNLVEQGLSLDAEPTAILKGATRVRLDPIQYRKIGSAWSFLTANDLQTEVTQERFDQFLKGEAEWSIFSAGAAFPRLLKRGSDSGASPKGSDKLADEVINRIDELEKREPDPRDSLRHIRIFCEPGSGTTTALREAATYVALRGYPVLVSKPSATKFDSGLVINFIVDILSRWHSTKPARERNILPIAIFVDKDAGEDGSFQNLPRALSTIGREIIIVRAYERTREEIDRAKGVLTLSADVSEAEMLQMGEHLRQFAKKHGLNPVPSAEEWRSYHAGLTYMLHYDAASRTSVEDVPYLFLIGIQPFISERVASLSALEQYYYQKWNSLAEKSLKTLVQIAAAAGYYNISIPYDALRRVQSLEVEALSGPKRLQEPLLDLFVEWREQGISTKNWYIRIRHPIVGRLLSRVIDPIDGDVPYKPLLPLITQLTSRDVDIWFAEQLVTRAGKSFKRFSPSFSLESDTPLQRAARALISAIPPLLKDGSRVVRHHEARYHMHVIHACVNALENPNTTTLNAKQIQEILNEEYVLARASLEKAIQISSAYEPDKNVYNTFALLMFDYADVAATQIDVGSSEKFSDRFSEAVDLQELAIGEDPTDALSRYQFAHRIFQSIPNSPIDVSGKLSLYSRAELRFEELLKLYQERRVRNIDPVDVEVQIAQLYQSYAAALAKVPNREVVLSEFKVKNPEAAIILNLRDALQMRSLKDGFRDQGTSQQLRALRDDLDRLPNRSARGTLYLYRLYVEDPLGRIEFEKRLEILRDLKQMSFKEYLPYWPDEASLLCQIDNLAGGSARFRELRAFRSQDRQLWFWVNERVLIETKGGISRPKQMSFVVRGEPREGYAYFQNTTTLIKFQQSEYPALTKNEAFLGFVRFTIDGMQVIPERFAKTDLVAMGLA